MTRKTTLAIASFVVSIASVASPAFAAGSTADTHAYLEAERTRTEGQAELIRFAESQGVAPVAAAVQRPAADAYFERELSRSEGSAGPVAATGPSLREMARSAIEFARGTSR